MFSFQNGLPFFFWRGLTRSNLRFPQAIFDRNRKDELPGLQLEWIDGICAPLYEVTLGLRRRQGICHSINRQEVLPRFHPVGGEGGGLRQRG